MHLRLCMTCGQVGCCDSSKNRHATAHFRQTGHPVLKSFEPRETWGWCYVDEVMLDARGWSVRGKPPTAAEGRSHLIRPFVH